MTILSSTLSTALARKVAAHIPLLAAQLCRAKVELLVEDQLYDAVGTFIINHVLPAQLKLFASAQTIAELEAKSSAIILDLNKASGISLSKNHKPEDVLLGYIRPRLDYMLSPDATAKASVGGFTEVQAFKLAADSYLDVLDTIFKRLSIFMLYKVPGLKDELSQMQDPEAYVKAELEKLVHLSNTRGVALLDAEADVELLDTHTVNITAYVGAYRELMLALSDLSQVELFGTPGGSYSAEKNSLLSQMASAKAGFLLLNWAEITNAFTDALCSSLDCDSGLKLILNAAAEEEGGVDAKADAPVVARTTLDEWQLKYKTWYTEHYNELPLVLQKLSLYLISQ